MQAQLIHLWLAEPVFFASRELSDTYEPFRKLKTLMDSRFHNFRERVSIRF